jgi:hypothetical protein
LDTIALGVSIATFIAVLLNGYAIYVALRQLKIGRSGASAGALIALNESFRQAWLEFTKVETEDTKQHAFADVMNLLETACAIFEDKLFVGKAADLLETYLCEVFILIEKSDDSRSRIQSMFTTPTTFQHITRFLSTHRERLRGLRFQPATSEA